MFFLSINLFLSIINLCFDFILQSCKAVYDRIIDLKIATPQIIINYGLFLEEQNYFEEAFKVGFLKDSYNFIKIILDKEKTL